MLFRSPAEQRSQPEPTRTVAKSNDVLVAELRLPANMDPRIREITAPLKAGPYVIGRVPEIHNKGEEHPFQITECEAEWLAQHWAKKLRYIYDWRETGYAFSEDMRMEPYANYRLGKIDDILGQERVQQLFDTVMGERRGHLTPSVLPNGSQSGSAEPDEQSQGEATATDKSGLEGVR